jgi:hypothetical protein
LAPSATTDTTNASNITSGTLPTARLSGSYTGITGVGTLAAGTWNGSTIGVGYGGTGLTIYTAGDLIYASGTSTLATIAAGTNGYVLTMSAGVPAWTASGGVSTFSAGTTGLTPSTATSGAVTLAGTLNVANGGTGLSSVTASRIPYGNGTGALQTSANLIFDGTTLTNTGNAVISDNSTSAALRITQVGTGNALLVEDSANPDATPTVIDASGNVGIGIAAPVSKLDVYAASGYVDARVRSGSNQSYVATDGGASYFGTYNNIPVIFSTGNITQFRIAHTASAVNYLEVTGSTTTNDPTITAQGSDTNIDVQIVPKGTGGLRFTGPLLPNNLAGTSGQVLTSAGAGAVPTWATPVGSNITTQGLYENNATISANYTIGTGNNAVSAGPITINSGVVVTVPSGSTWVVV